jgi:BirA family biotin operon repressor/biotin-[acetyl-CoA-carboxylase] ligase
MIFKEDGYVVIIGTGINVNAENFPEDIRETATSLNLELGKEIEKETIIVSVMKYFEIFYEQYEKSEDFSLLKEAYETLLANKDKSVRVLDPKGAYDGVAKGVNDAGNLIVVREDGSTVEIDSGEVSVRGIYGYV